MSCTDSHALPIFDTMVAVGAGIGIGAVARRESDCTGEHCGAGAAFILPLLPVVLVAAPSAIWGFGTVGKCRGFKREHADEERAFEALEADIRRLAMEGKCSEIQPLWDEMLAQEQALNFEHPIEDFAMARCPGIAR